MKNIYLILFLFIFLSIHSFSQDSVSVKNTSGKLILNVVGFENENGNLRIALCNTKENYSSEDMPFKTGIVSIQDKKAQHTFGDLSFGIYAFKIFHDENENGELDTNFLGIPSENYGFSNNAKGSFGPASWEDAQFKFEKDSLVIEIDFNK